MAVLQYRNIALSPPLSSLLSSPLLSSLLSLLSHLFSLLTSHLFSLLSPLSPLSSISSLLSPLSPLTPHSSLLNPRFSLLYPLLPTSPLHSPLLLLYPLPSSLLLSSLPLSLARGRTGISGVYMGRKKAQLVPGLVACYDLRKSTFSPLSGINSCTLNSMIRTLCDIHNLSPIITTSRLYHRCLHCLPLKAMFAFAMLMSFWTCSTEPLDTNITTHYPTRLDCPVHRACDPSLHEKGCDTTNRKFIIFGNDGNGIGNQLVFFPVVYVFAMVQGRQVSEEPTSTHEDAIVKLLIASTERRKP